MHNLVQVCSLVMTTFVLQNGLSLLNIVKALIEAEANISQANKVSTVCVTVSFHNLCTGGEHVHAAQRLLL